MPKKVDEIKKRVQKQNPSYDESRAWATAWSIYCKHVNPDSDSCQRPPSGYLKKKKKKKRKKKAEEDVAKWIFNVAQDLVSSS